jgi:hypothetical protein
MNRIVRSAGCALFFSVALCAFAAAPASSPFDGTWHIELAKTKFSPKPLSFYIGHGWYHCITCNPTFTVPADGQDHAVTGQAYDSISVKIVDPHTISTTVSKNGKVIGEQTRTVSDNGKVLTVKGTEHSMDGDKTSTYEAVAKRSGMAPADVELASGDWIIEKESGSENSLVTVYKLDGDDLTMSAPTGETYTAKLDGGDFPVKGAYGWDTVSLKKINAHSIEETDKRGGTVTDVSTMTVAGKTMTIVDNDKLSDRTSTYVARKD